jgi:hypothetical protein
LLVEDDSQSTELQHADLIFPLAEARIIVWKWRAAVRTRVERLDRSRVKGVRREDEVEGDHAIADCSRSQQVSVDYLRARALLCHVDCRLQVLSLVGAQGGQGDVLVGCLGFALALLAL